MIFKLFIVKASQHNLHGNTGFNDFASSRHKLLILRYATSPFIMKTRIHVYFELNGTQIISQKDIDIINDYQY